MVEGVAGQDSAVKDSCAGERATAESAPRAPWLETLCPIVERRRFKTDANLLLLVASAVVCCRAELSIAASSAFWLVPAGNSFRPELLEASSFGRDPCPSHGPAPSVALLPGPASVGSSVGDDERSSSGASRPSSSVSRRRSSSNCSRGTPAARKGLVASGCLFLPLFRSVADKAHLNRFLMALSDRPGRSFEIFAHVLPNRA